MREIVLLNTLDRPPHHHLMMGCIVIDHAVLQGLDLVLAISRWIRFAVDYHDSARIGEVSIRMGYIIALEHDLSLRGDIISESLEHIDHMGSREALIL